MCGVFPIAICIMMFSFFDELKFLKKRLVILGVISIAISVFGLLANKAALESKTLTLSSPLNNEITSALLSFVQLFYNPYDTEVFSLKGIQQLINFCILLFIIAFGLMSITKSGGIKMALENRKIHETWREEFAEAGLISIFACNTIILMLTSSQARYHLVGAIPLMICAVINFFRFAEKHRDSYVPDIIAVSLIGLIITQTIVSIIYARADYIHKEDESSNVIRQIVEVADNNKIETVFIFADESSELSEKLRAYDISRDYESLTLEGSGISIKNWDYYAYACDRAYFSERNAIVVKDTNSIDELPLFVQETYSPISDFIVDNNSYVVYFSDTNPIDGVIGFPAVDKSVDLPSSSNFTANGDIDKHGWLQTDLMGVIFASPGLYSDGEKGYNITLNYESDDDSNLTYELYCNMNLIESLPMEADQNKVSFSIPPVAGEYIYAVRNETPGDVVIKDIHYDVIK